MNIAREIIEFWFGNAFIFLNKKIDITNLFLDLLYRGFILKYKVENTVRD